MNQNIKFSVSMCVYGGDNAQWFETAVESILKQSLVPDEIIVVVDGPIPEDLDKLIQKYDEMELFSIIRLEENKGHGTARKIGLDNCTNEIVAIMDADDICNPKRFEKQILVFSDNPNVDIVGGMISEFIDTPDNIVGKRIVPLEDYEIKEYMKRRCPMNLVTVMFKKSSIEKVGGFIDWYCEEDYYLWLRMALAKMEFKNIKDIVVNVRVGKEMYQRRGGIKYFKSEAKLQWYMKRNNIIGWGTFFMNVTKRLIVQVMLPNKVRGWIFKKFARKR